MTTTSFEAEMKASVGQIGDEVKRLIGEREKATGDKLTEYDNRIKKLEEIGAKLATDLEKAERLHVPGTELGKNAEKGKFSCARLAKLMAGLAKETDKECGYEVEVHREMVKRLDAMPEVMKTAINASSGASGAFLISTEINNELLKELEPGSIASQLGMRTITGLSSNVSWNRDLGGISAGYLDSEAEETGSETTATFGNMELKPHVYAAFVPLTFGMLTQPAMNIESWVRERMAVKIGLLKDNSAFKGTGSNSQPRGLKLSGITTVSWSGVDYTGSGQTLTDKLMLMGAQLPMANAVMPGAKLGFATGPFVINKLQNAKDTTEKPLLWTPNSTNLMNGPMRMTQILSTPVRESTQLNTVAGTAQTTEEIYYGDYNQLGDFNWGTLAFASSDSTETNFRKLRVTIRAVGAHDIGVFYPSCFVLGSNVDAT